MAASAEHADVATTPLVSLTPEARAVVRDAMAAEADADRLALWLEVRGVQQGSFSYDLYFQALSDAGEDDAVQPDDELPVVIPATSVEALRGARLEWSDEGDGGLVLVNPNSPPVEDVSGGVPPEVMAAGIDTPVARRVVAVLEEMVNPSIAGHGGRADLVAMDEEGGVAYLRLSGGCQGCAMSPSRTRCPRSSEWSTSPTTLRARTPTTDRPLRFRVLWKGASAEPG
jgi:Fe/S biogenesis protein NfuA